MRYSYTSEQRKVMIEETNNFYKIKIGLYDKSTFCIAIGSRYLYSIINPKQVYTVSRDLASGETPFDPPKWKYGISIELE